MATLAAISRVKGCWARKRASSSAAPRSRSSATRASSAGPPSAARESEAELRENEAANAAANEAFFMGCLCATKSFRTPVVKGDKAVTARLWHGQGVGLKALARRSASEICAGFM